MAEKNTQEQEKTQKERERDRRKIRIKVYFNEEEFSEVITDSEQAHFRRGGLKPFVQKARGFSEEKLANTDGISKFLKFCWREWQRIRAEGRDLQAEIEKRKQEIAALERQAGLGKPKS